MNGLIVGGMVLIALQGMVLNRILECRKKHVKVPVREWLRLALLFVILIGVLLVRRYAGELGVFAVAVNALCTVAMTVAAIWVVGLRLVITARCMGSDVPSSTFWINAAVDVVFAACFVWILYDPVVELLNLFN